MGFADGWKLSQEYPMYVQLLQDRGFRAGRTLGKPRVENRDAPGVGTGGRPVVQNVRKG
jgi:hypothetical protein